MVDTVSCGPDDVIGFGKHIGRSYREIIRDDPSYMAWAIANVKQLRITDEVVTMTKKANRAKAKAKAKPTWILFNDSHWGVDD